MYHFMKAGILSYIFDFAVLHLTIAILSCHRRYIQLKFLSQVSVYLCESFVLL